MTHYSYNEFHLGDSLIHMHFLRHLALGNPGHEFVHAVHGCHVAQLEETITDVPSVSLKSLDSFHPNPMGRPDSEWRNVWKNAGATVTNGGPTPNYVPGFWEKHPLRNDYAGFYLAWFQYLAAEMGLKSPFNNREDLLFDYPAILTPTSMTRDFDWLVVNSQPSSGQLRSYDSVEYLTPLIQELAKRNSVITTRLVDGIPCTAEHNLTVTGIGNLSLHCHGLLMISTGPSWPTWNIWNQRSIYSRIVLIDNGERIEYAPNTIHVRNRDEARAALVVRASL